MARIRHLFVLRHLAEMAEVRAMIQRIGIQAQLIDHPRQAFDFVRSFSDPVSAGKQTLLLTENKGAYIKDCPGTRHYRCCGYRVVHTASYCYLDCAYCILQTFFHPPLLQFFVNHDRLFAQLAAAVADEADDGIRFGTGEYTDSLIWDRWHPLTEQLVDFFGRQDRCVLELKTKTTAIDRLTGRNHGRKTIVSWSLNTPYVINTMERGTATLGARLRAAARCQAMGYPVGFHFDPLVIYPGCEADYRQVVHEMTRHLVEPDTVVWISLGSFRYPPELKPVARARFAGSGLTCGEFVQGKDGKWRYLRFVRQDLYRAMADWLQEAFPHAAVYLCMENDKVWQHAFGYSPEKEGGLALMLDRAARRHCNLR